MKRFLVLYTSYNGQQCYAEGLIHIDGMVYVRGFWIQEGKLFTSLLDVRHYFRDHNDIRAYQILELDKAEAA